MAPKKSAKKPAPKPAAKKSAENRPAKAASARPVRADLPNPTLPAVDEDLEIKKQRGQTESQQAMRKYHEGEFQKNDPVTGEAREDGDAVLEDSK